MKKQDNLSIILTGGGTGGHIYPAIAVAQVLKNDPEVKNLYYIGCAKNPEKEIAKSAGLEFFSLNVSGMPRKPGVKFLLWLFELTGATVKACKYLLKLKPDTVFGTGGYATGPVLMAAWLLRIPYVIHDPDAHPGIVNKFMERGAKTVSLAFEGAKKYIKNPNSEVFGNPMRGSLTQIDKNAALNQLNLSAEKKTILVIGGSQGARSINNTMLDATPVFIRDMGFQVIHQTGKKNFDEYMKNFSSKYPDLANKPAYIVKPYFEDISVPLNAADVAVSRAGSLSISELNLCKLPSVLIPYPYAAADHQRYNARAMENAGAALYLEDADCKAEKLIELVGIILNNPKKLETMQQANCKLAKPDAVFNIIKKIKSAARV